MNTRTRCWVVAALMVVGCGPVLAALPDGWFAGYVAERTAPGVLTGPVEEKWRANADAAIVRGDRVLLATSVIQVTEIQVPPTPDIMQHLMAQEEATVRGLECRAIDTGAVLWHVELDREAGERATGAVWLDNVILVRIHHGRVRFPITLPEGAASAPSTGPARRLASELGFKECIWLLDPDTGAVLRRFERSVTFGDDDRSAAMQAYRGATPTPGAPLLLNRDLIERTYLQPGGPSVPVSADPAGWSCDDAELVMSVLGENAIPRCGAVSGLVSTMLYPTGKVVWVDSLGFRLCKGSLASETPVWETPFIGGRGGLARLPCMIVAFSAASAITSYDEETGRPLWTYEWPSVDLAQHYTRQMAALTDGLLLLTDPQVPRPITMRKFEGVYRSTHFNTRSFLTKLDMRGHVVFRQELPVLVRYGRMLVGPNALLVWSGRLDMEGHLGGEGPVVCLGLADPTRPGKPMADADRVKAQQLIASYDAAEVRERVVISTDLAELGDTSMVDRVRSDLTTADRADRVFYVQALAILRDQRVVPDLVALLEDATAKPEDLMDPGEARNRLLGLNLQQEIATAILALTEGDPLKSEPYRQWRDRRIPALRAEYDRTRDAGEHLRIAEQLGELRDPQLLERLLQSLESAPANVRGYYVIALGQQKDKQVIPKLVSLLSDGDVGIRHTVQDALRRATGVDCYKAEAWERWWRTHRHLYEAAPNGSNGKAVGSR